MSAVKPGAPIGNDNASKGKPWRDALDRAIKQDSGKRLRASAEALLDAGAAGEQWAVRELADRLDGKSIQGVAVSGDVGLTITQVERVIIDSALPNIEKE